MTRNKKETQDLKSWVKSKKHRKQIFRIITSNFFSRCHNLTYLSWWIANLGVVPLFLFSALRFDPADLAFAFLLLLVTAVLETILPLLYQSTKNLKISNSSKYLHGSGLNVKRLILSSVLLSGFSLSGLAEELSPSKNKEDLVMAIGEHRQFTPSQVHHFALTNRQVLTPTFSPKKGLIIRAKSQGFSELILWDPQGLKKVYAVNIINKRDQQQMLNVIGEAESLGLRALQNASGISFYGHVFELKNYQRLVYLKKKFPELELDIELSKELKHILLEKTYQLFYEQFIDQAKCIFEQHILACQIPPGHPEIKKIRSSLEKNYLITFREIVPIPLGQNLKIKLKIIQIERSDGREINLGLNQLNARLEDVFYHGIAPLIEKNQIMLRQYDAKIETLAEPQLILQLDQEAKITLGAEMPYPQHSDTGNVISTQWKFSGLQVTLKCQHVNGKLILTYQTELSATATSSSGAIAGNSQLSQASIELDRPLELFDVALKGDELRQQSIPLLGDIPFLGKIFSSHELVTVNKRIIALAEVKLND